MPQYYYYAEPRHSYRPRSYDDSYYNYDRRPSYSTKRYYRDDYDVPRHHSSHHNSWKPKSHSRDDWGYHNGSYNRELEQFSRDWPSYRKERSATKYAAKATAYGARRAFHHTGADVGLGIITAGVQGLGWGVTKAAEYLFLDDKPRKHRHHHHRR